MAEEQKKTSTKASKTKPKEPPAQKPVKAKAPKPDEEQLQLTAAELVRKERLRAEIWAVIFIAFGLFLVLSLHMDAMGVIGAFFKHLLFGLFGKVAFVIAYFLIVYGVLIFAQKTAFLTVRAAVCLICLFIFLTCIFSVPYVSTCGDGLFKLVKTVYALGVEGPGVIGLLLGGLLFKLIDKAGLYILCTAGSIITLLFIINTPLSALFDNSRIKKQAKKKIKTQTPKAKENQIPETQLDFFAPEGSPAKPEEVKVSETKSVAENDIPKLNLNPFKVSWHETENALPGQAAEEVSEEISGEKIPSEPDQPEVSVFEEYPDNKKQILEYVSDDNLFGSSKADAAVSEPEPVHKTAPKTIPLAELAKADTEVKAELSKQPVSSGEYKFPPISLLQKPAAKKGASVDLDGMAKQLEDCMHSFGVEATVTNVIQGPSVTRFEVQPAVGVKVSSIARLKDDIALNLRAKSIRIEAPIPGMAAVGIEIANSDISTVYLRDVLDSKEFKTAKSKISVALGKSIAGDNVIMDIRKMPHLLIAGTTGSGKSVCINSILISLLYKAKPEEVKLLLIDPKVIELQDYNGIPHLMLPVVTDPAKASAALSWAVSEMNDRYNKFAEEGGVKDLESYNEKVRANLEEDKVMPQIVIIVDELADLIMSAKNSVEDSICRLAQKARAAGMHLIIATQTPRSDVITGVIKANLPSKIALAVSTALDSRIILDQSGAESLLGKGDMLYNPQDFPQPLRVQCCYVDEKEVPVIVKYIIDNNCVEEQSPMMQDIMAVLEKNAQSADSSESELEDDLLMDAIECVVHAQSCSVSMLQRRFRIGYNRSARIVELMEERGIVGPADGARPRKVLMTKEEFAEMEEGLNTDVPEEI